MSARIAVVGAGLSGLRAAEKLRAAGWSDELVVLGDEHEPAYNRPPLTKEFLAGSMAREKLAYRRRRTTEDVEWRHGVRVSAADVHGRTLTTAAGETLRWDGLVVATGVRSRHLPLSLHGQSTRWHDVRTVGDSVRLREQLAPETRVAVIGAGFIGTEVAATASSLGCRVTVVEPLSTPVERALGVVLGRELQRRHEEHGVEFRLGRTLVDAGSASPEGLVRLTLDDGEELEADVVVEAVGSIANTEWLAGQRRGPELDLTDGVRCDEHLHPFTVDGRSLSRVVALGDVASFRWRHFPGDSHRVEHWTTPGDTAAHAARSLVAGVTGAPADPVDFAPVPTFWTDQYGTRVQSFGLPHLGADDVRVLEGDLRAECALGYHVDERLVGVVLLGLPRRMVELRARLVADLEAQTASTHDSTCA